MPRLSVVIPAFNEAARLPATLDSLAAFLGAAEWTSEVVVVDDGSADDTSAVAAARVGDFSSLRVARNETNRGKGFTVKRGVELAEGEVVLFYDADASTPIAEIEKFWPEFERGADVVIGSRSLPGSDVRVHQPWYRENMGRMFNVFVQLLVMPGIIDTQCGFKAFRRECARKVFPRQQLSGFAFDVELLYIARKLGYRIAEMPIVWINSPASRVNPLWDSLGMLIDLLKIRALHARGAYRIAEGRL